MGIRPRRLWASDGMGGKGDSGFEYVAVDGVTPLRLGPGGPSGHIDFQIQGFPVFDDMKV